MRDDKIVSTVLLVLAMVTVILTVVYIHTVSN